MKKILAVLILATFLPLAAASDSMSWSGRRSVLYATALVMLEQNEPYIWGKQDCSMQMWRLVKDLFPEYDGVKWFRRDRAEVMASWPFSVVMTISQAQFGDFLFANSEDYPNGSSQNAKLFHINHIMMQWVKPGKAIHAGKKRGFSETSLEPYWSSRLILITRPPY